MTKPSDHHDRPPFDADDPRLSEWIDGRLSPAEAAAVERTVRSSPGLTRIVSDLRAIKEAAKLVPAVSPPEGFVDRVMEAVSMGGAARRSADAESDRAVEREWQAIEAERIAEEQAEARADLVEAAAGGSGGAVVTTRRAWPWLAIGTALAAGLLLAVVLNVPRPESDAVEVAVMADREAESRDKGRALSRAAEQKPAAALELDRDPAAVAVAVAEPQPASKLLEKAAADADTLAEPIEVVVSGPEGRASLFERLKALGLAAAPPGFQAAAREPPAAAAAAREPPSASPGMAAASLPADALEAGGPPARISRLAPGASLELLELVGPEEAVAAFLAGEAKDGEAKRAWSDRRPGGPEGPSGERARATPSRRILIRVIQMPAAAGEPSEP